MKIVFIGTVNFSETILKTLLHLNANVVGICTLKKSSFNSDFNDLSKLADNKKIPYKYCNDINSESSISWIKDKDPDIIFCIGWPRLIKKKLLNLPPKGVVGYHPTLLPKNRGRHPIIWALNLGLKETGSTFFFMNEGADSGPIISQKEVIISKKDDALSLYQKIENIASNQLKLFFNDLLNGSINPNPQREDKANYWRKRIKNDGLINWNMSSLGIYNLVRALSKPYPGASFYYKDKEIKLFKCEIIKNKKNNIEPGKIISADKNIIVKTSDGALALLNLEPHIKIKKGEYL